MVNSVALVAHLFIFAMEVVLPKFFWLLHTLFIGWFSAGLLSK